MKTSCILLLLTLTLFSCKSLRNENYEAIRVFLETEKIDKTKKYILQKEQTSSKITLRIFNGGDGAEHIMDPLDPIDFTKGLHKDKHWRKLYKKHIKDTIGYWVKEDFPEYNFVLESDKFIFTQNFHYTYSVNDEVIWISKPIYYWNKKYILFTYQKGLLYGGSSICLVIMKKEKGKWVIVDRFGDYNYY
ncbi:hypothetical protein [Flavobacterium gilvum]|uniref:Lipoprotein n=1 Tax=Flavobacterium gilvum TaxID=1492737 RepID=A0AAC9N508_9FLAO|nr:hypothetical protein [Flavobacterium gilvum]AOW08667.1 hypothetical protein EM308_03660 [Flavobacterium gilvum]KFC59906.1 hypothetical protein FEM08_14170 [Flavobacterium gilvum]